MLCVVPPISLGAVFYGRYLRKLSNLTQEAIGDMSKVRRVAWYLFPTRGYVASYFTERLCADGFQTAEEKLNAFKTVAAYNSQNQEATIFGKKVDQVFALAKKEAYMSGIFWGASGLTGNLALLALLGYGECPAVGFVVRSLFV